MIANSPRQLSDRYLSPTDREEISRGLAEGDSFRKIGRAVGARHPRFSREVTRNGGRHEYRAVAAQQQAHLRARSPKTAKLAAGSELRNLAQDALTRHWTPEQNQHGAAPRIPWRSRTGH